MRRALGVSLALLLAVSIFAGTPAGAKRKSKRWEPSKWMAALSQPRYSGIVSSTHHLKADDGTTLSLVLHLPQGLEDGKKIPTLMQMTPYQPLDQALNAYAAYDFFVVRGAAYVEADERGSGGSGGCLDFGGSADRSDAKVFAEWIRSQPWSNGRIVTDGVSHPGMGSLVAHTAIDGLTGALAHAPVVSYYQDEWLQGAKFEDQFNGPLYQAIELAPPQPPEYTAPDGYAAQAATCTGETTLDYSTYDGPFTELWADRDLSRHVPKKRSPVLLTHGFVDLNVHPDHSQLYWDALPDNYPKYAIFGWWYHGYPDMFNHPAKNFDFWRHRWLDATLFNIDNGLWAEPRVLVEDSQGTWHESHDWPLDRSKKKVLFPADDTLDSKPGKPGSVSYFDELDARRGAWTDASVVFRSEPLDKAMLVNGAPILDLTASSDATSTKWVAYLIDEAPNGAWQRITHGYADSHSWKQEDLWEEIEPGKSYRWKLNLMPTAVVVEEGHRLALVIASQDSRRMPGSRCFSDYRGGCYNPSGILPATSVGRATNTVHTGPGATKLTFHWVDPTRTAKPPF